MDAGPQGVLRIPRLPDGAVGRPGVDRVHQRRVIGAVLDRNGLRPSRYYVTKDDLVIMASEVGVLPVEPEDVAKKWRLQPGKIFLVDMKQGRIVDDREIKRELVDKRPWKRWLEENMIDLDELPEPSNVHQPDHDTLLVRQHAFGYTVEDLKMIITPMAVNGWKALGSMGTDTPLACLSDKPQLLYNYFKQLFAQVTNPPLDAIREELVTSLYTYLGREGNLLDETPKALPPDQAEAADPEQRRSGEAARSRRPAICARSRCRCCSTSPKAKRDWRRRSTSCATRAAKAVKDGASILILSDRGVDRGQRADPEPARDRGRASSPDPRRHAHAVRPGHRDRRSARSRITSAC